MDLAQHIHAKMLTAHGPPQFQIALFERNPDERNRDNKDDRGAESKVHGFADYRLPTAGYRRSHGNLERTVGCRPYRTAVAGSIRATRLASAGSRKTVPIFRSFGVVSLSLFMWKI